MPDTRANGMSHYQPQLFALGLVGIVFGVGLLVRGLVAYRRGSVVGSIATSHANSLAAGEVRMTGTVEALASTLVSALQSAPSVWYHSRIVEKGDSDHVLLDEQRAVDFLLRDDTGTVRVVPRGARYEVAPEFDATTNLLGEEPIGLNRRVGAASMAVADYDREAAIADLLTVRPPNHDDDGEHASVMPIGIRRPGNARRHYTESRLEPGARVTLVGFARPFGELDPLGPAATAADGSSLDPTTFDDPEIAAEMAEAQAAGTLATNARAAWGNAAIPGFGIGRPVESPTLEAGATPEVPAEPSQAARAERIFEIAPETLVISSGDRRPLTVYDGAPTEAVAFDRVRFYRGLAGGGIAAVSAVLLAVTMNGSV